MIQKLIMTATISSLFLLNGCGQTAPDLSGIDAGRNNISDATHIAGETVSIDENAYGNENGTNINGSGINANNGNYNSSANGFQSIYFEFGNYGITSSMENHIITNATIINGANTTRIKIEGNCDEFGTDEYNYALGLKRAKAVKDIIVSQGVAEDKMVIISFGESNPVCFNPTDECYAQNRRVDLRFVK